MAYGKYSRGARTTRYRRSYVKRAGSSTYKKVVKPARQALSALQRQVNAIRRSIVPLTQNKMFYQHSDNINIGNISGSAVGAINLTKCSNWTRIFGTDADDEQSHIFNMQKMKLMGQVNTNGERALINTTLCIVTLTKLGVSELWNTSLGTLNPIYSGTHFTTAVSTQGLGITLNPKYFRAHWWRRMITGSPGGIATDTPDLCKGFAYTHTKTVKFLNPGGDWKAKGFCPNVLGNLFLLYFNNDNSADADLALTYNTVYEGIAV